MNSQPSSTELKTYLDFASEIAREAGRITLQYFRTVIEIERKSDDSPVTIADRETEQHLIQRIRDQFPNHGILGEELGQVNAGSSWRWILDPIDGTQSFIHGVPLYTVLVALMHEDTPHLGVIYNPPSDDLVAAATGLGCTLNGRPTHVSTVGDFARARVHTTDWSHLAARRPRFTHELLGKLHFARTWGDGFGYMMVASGRAEAMIDPKLSAWDVAPMVPILTEAGGRFTSLEGEVDALAASGLATNGILHDQLLALARLDELLVDQPQPEA